MSRSRPGAHGGDPDAPKDEGLSIFGPLELPRDETELLPAYDEYAAHGDGDAGGTRVASPSMLMPPHPGGLPPAGPPPVQPPMAPPVNPAVGAVPGYPPPPYPGSGPGQYPPGAGGPPQAPGPQATEVFPEGLFRDEPPAAPGAGYGPGPGYAAPAPGHPAPPAAPPYAAAPQYSAQPQYSAPPQYAQPQYSAPSVPRRRTGAAGGSGRGTGQGMPRAAVVAGVVGAVVVLLAVIVFATGVLGGDDDTKNAGGGPTAEAPAVAAGPSASASASPTAPATSAAPPKSQARQLDELFDVSAGSRTTVQEAVREIQKCGDIAGAVRSLDEAAGQRDQQVSTLGTLKVDEIARGDELAASLRTAWQASAKADRAYAAWGRESADGACKRGKSAKRTDNRKDADDASKDATEAKNKAVALWNPEAAKAGLGKRTAGEI